MARLNPQVVLLTLIATLGGLLFGYDTAVINGAVDSLKAYFIDPRFTNLASPAQANAADSLLGFVVSSALIGCIIGGLIGGWVSTRIGRKRGLIIAAVLFLISALGASAPEFPFAPIGHGGPGYMANFVFYRILGGIGVGLASMLSPMYIAEIAPPKVRGNLVAWNQFAIIFGMLVIYFVNFGISKSGSGDAWLNTIGWRYMFLSGAIPAGLFLLLLFPGAGDAALPDAEGRRERRARGAGQAGDAGGRRKGTVRNPRLAQRASLRQAVFLRRDAHLHRHHACRSSSNSSASTSCSIMPPISSRAWASPPMPRCSRPSLSARSTSSLPWLPSSPWIDSAAGRCRSSERW